MSCSRWMSDTQFFLPTCSVSCSMSVCASFFFNVVSICKACPVAWHRPELPATLGHGPTGSPPYRRGLILRRAHWDGPCACRLLPVVTLKSALIRCMAGPLAGRPPPLRGRWCCGPGRARPEIPPRRPARTPPWCSRLEGDEGRDVHGERRLRARMYVHVLAVLRLLLQRGRVWKTTFYAVVWCRHYFRC